MINGKRWFAFFSHTGTEIVNVSNDLGIAPDCVITNRAPGEINEELYNLTTVQYTTDRPKAQHYDQLLSDCRDKCICTLHGWMRIVPPRICEEYEMYNLHPGLITEYPELKGKDPQARVNSEDHENVGVVIHKVTPGVDEGEVLLVCSEANVYSDTNAVTEQLHKMASDTWSVFFTDYLLANDTQL